MPFVCPLDNMCPANQDCDGYRPVCPANISSWIETLIAFVTLVKASHLAELETTINSERTHPVRRDVFNPIMCPMDGSPACPNNCSDSYTFSGSRGVGNLIRAVHFTNVQDANDTTPFGSDSTADIYIGKVIYKVDIDEIRDAINQTEYNCICDMQCTCNFNCGCNGECPAYSYYYY
jgi:hypothetical protein